MFGLQNIASASDYEQDFAVRYNQHRFEVFQVFVGAPVFCQFDRGADQLPRCGFQFGFKTFHQGEGIRRRPCKPAHNVMPTRINPADLFGGAFDDRLAKANLPVTSNHHFAAFANTHNRGAVPAGEFLIVLHVCLHPIGSNLYGGSGASAQVCVRRIDLAECAWNPCVHGNLGELWISIRITGTI